MWFRLSIGARLILFHHHIYFARIWCDDELLIRFLAWLGSLFRLVRHEVQRLTNAGLLRVGAVTCLWRWSHFYYLMRLGRQVL